MRKPVLRFFMKRISICLDNIVCILVSEIDSKLENRFPLCFWDVYDLNHSFSTQLIRKQSQKMTS